MRSQTAQELLAEVERARSKTRAKRRGAWFALTMFGVILLAAAPLYVSRRLAVYADGSTLSTSGGWWVSLYWLLALPLGYAACVWYYRRHADRTGVSGAFWPWVLAGLVLFALMSLVPPGIVAGWIPSFLAGWTSLPLMALAGGFLVLAWLERNPYLAALSVGLFAVPTLSERYYDTFLGWNGFSGLGFTMVVAGLVLVCAGAIAWMTCGREA